MKHHEIEAWALDVVERAKAGQQIEDARVELKAELIPPERAARRLAAHANAARGALILWIVGVDEAAHTVTGCDRAAFEKWWEQIVSRFDGIAPDVTDIVVPVPEDPSVLALQFDTVRRPFVVKSAQQDDDRLEVPWRGSTSTRSARRAELIQLLTDVVTEAQISVLSGMVTATPVSNTAEMRWEASLQCYIDLPFESALVLPDHQVTADLLDEPTGLALPFGGAYIGVPVEYRDTQPTILTTYPTSQMYTAHRGFEQTIVTGPGILIAHAVARETTDPPRSVALIGEPTMTFEATPIGATSPIVVRGELRAVPTHGREAGRWTVHGVVEE